MGSSRENKAKRDMKQIALKDFRLEEAKKYNSGVLAEQVLAHGYPFAIFPPKQRSMVGVQTNYGVEIPYTRKPYLSTEMYETEVVAKRKKPKRRGA